MISENQIDAALGLLGLKRNHVAEQLGINVTTFNSYFSAGVRMKPDRNAQVKEYLEGLGVVFTPTGGVEPAQEIIRVYRGQDGFQEFMTDVYETCRDVGGNLYVTNADETLFDKWMGKEFEKFYATSMRAIPKGHFWFHIITHEGAEYLPVPHGEYRWIPKQYFSPISTYIYGNKLANIMFLEDDVVVRVYDQKDFVESQIKQFLFIWNHADAFEEHNPKY